MTDTHRNHFIPQYYQRGFCCVDSPGEIWSIEKGTARTFKAGLPVVGMKKDLYSYERNDGTWDASTMERYLTEEIEGPANPLFDKVRAQQPISLDEKKTLATYVAVMMKRVPKHWERAQLAAPRIAPKLANQYEKLIDALIKRYPEQVDRFEHDRQRGLEYLHNIAEDPPNSVVVNTINTTLTEPLYGMSWTFLVVRHGRPLFTSDNPVFFSEERGLRHPLGELVFPISSAIALYATNDKEQVPKYKIAGESIVREVHRRTASFAQRFFYSPLNELWLTNLAQQSEYRIRKQLYRD